MVWRGGGAVGKKPSQTETKETDVDGAWLKITGSMMENKEIICALADGGITKITRLLKAQL